MADNPKRVKDIYLNVRNVDYVHRRVATLFRQGNMGGTPPSRDSVMQFMVNFAYENPVQFSWEDRVGQVEYPSYMYTIEYMNNQTIRKMWDMYSPNMSNSNTSSFFGFVKHPNDMKPTDYHLGDFHFPELADVYDNRLGKYSGSTKKGINNPHQTFWHRRHVDRNGENFYKNELPLRNQHMNLDFHYQMNTQ
jgi:hypothetical protein